MAWSSLSSGFKSTTGFSLCIIVTTTAGLASSSSNRISVHHSASSAVLSFNNTCPQKARLDLIGAHIRKGKLTAIIICSKSNSRNSIVKLSQYPPDSWIKNTANTDQFYSADALGIEPISGELSQVDFFKYRKTVYRNKLQCYSFDVERQSNAKLVSNWQDSIQLFTNGSCTVFLLSYDRSIVAWKDGFSGQFSVRRLNIVISKPGM
jgi:hypothetical protein